MKKRITTTDYYDSEFEAHWLTQKFYDEELEKPFLEAFFKIRVSQVRVVLIIFTIIYGLIGFVNSYVFSGAEPGMPGWPFFLFFLAAIGAYTYSFNEAFRDSWQFILSAVVVFAGFGAVSFLSYLPPEAYLIHGLEISALFIFGYLFLGLRFIWALVSAWLVVAFYNINALVIQNLTPDSLTEINLSFVIFNIAGMYSSYLMERIERKRYIQRRQFKTERSNLVQITQKLEENNNNYSALARQKDKLEKDLESGQEALKNLNVRLEIEKILTNLAVRLIQIPPQEIDNVIHFGLQSIGDFAGADRSYIYLFKKRGTILIKTHEWLKRGIKPKIEKHEQVGSEEFTWLIQSLKQRRPFGFTRLEELPPQASTMRAIFEVEGIHSMLLVPLVLKYTIVGLIGVDYIRNNNKWNSELESLLINAGDTFVHALDKKRSSEVTRKSETRLKALFERSEDVVFVSTPGGKLLDINPAGAKLFGYPTVDELLSVDIAEDLYYNPEDRSLWKKLLEKQGHIKDYELTLKRRNGKKIVVLETTTAVRNEEGKIVAYEGIIRDVTEKRDLEEQLFQSQKMESIGLLAGGIAHDFNNILTALNGYAEMVLKNLEPNHPQLNNVRNIIRGGKRAEQLIRQLLAFSRKQIIEPRIVDINEVITELKRMLRRLIDEDIELRTVLGKGVSKIKADPGQIEQVLVNMIVNSRDAINQKTDILAPRKIIIGTEEVFLNKSFVLMHPGSREGRHVVISVTDTGIGMDEETKRKIFEPFFTSKENGKGTGLGLSTVYGIVKQNNGSIYVESEIGKGTTFKIYWPSTDQNDDTSLTEETSEIVEKAGETVLVVEDDPDVRELACSFLNSLGYNVYEAENGLRALELLERNNLINKIDLLFTDMVMPHMGGDRLAQEITKRNSAVKILLTSGYTDSQFLKSGFTERGYQFLHKPYSIQQMAKKVRKILDE